MTPTIYSATVKNYSGREFRIAAETTSADYSRDLRTVAQIVTGLQYAAIRLQDVKQCTANGEVWAWCDTDWRRQVQP